MILYLLAVLAVYRLARMIATEEGPLALFERTRARLGGNDQADWLGRGIACPLCVGFWVSLVVSLLLLPFSSWNGLVLNWLGIAGGAAALQMWLER